MNKQKVKQTAETMIAENGLINLSRRDLCERAGIADGSFIYIMGCTFTDFVKQFKDNGTNHRVNKNRVTNPALRKEHILSVALTVACEIGYYNLTRDAIAETAGVSMGLVSRYFGTMAQLKNDVVRAAVKRKIPQIVAQGLADGNKYIIKNAPQDLKTQAAIIIAKS